MRKKTIFVVGALVAAVIVGVALLRPRPVPEPAQPDAMPTLAFALHACYGINRVGRQTTTVSAGKEQVTAEVELAYRRPGLTRLRYVSGPLRGAEVWEDHHRIYRYLPDKGRVEVYPAEASEPMQLEDRLELMRQNYTASLEGKERVAGRQALRVVVRPRHSGNPWKRIWIDEESYLMLGSEDYSPDGRLLRSTRFTSLDLREEPESYFRPEPALLKEKKVTWNPAADEVPLSPERISRRVGYKVLLPKYLPPGYQFVGSFIVQCQCPLGDKIVRSQYTDGLNTISLFHCGHSCSDSGNCWVSNVPQAVAVQLSRGKDSFQIVGEIDRSELEKMARSIPAPAAPGT